MDVDGEEGGEEGVSVSGGLDCVGFGVDELDVVGGSGVGEEVEEEEEVGEEGEFGGGSRLVLGADSG